MQRWLRWFALVSPVLFLLFTHIIGFMTPGYCHMSQTISRLSIGTYGWLQTINLLVFSTGLLAATHSLSIQAKTQKTQRFIQGVLIVSSVMVLLLAIFPTDPIDSFPRQIFTISINAILHFFIVGAFIILSPFAIAGLVRAFNTDPDFKSLVTVTHFLGISAFTLSIIWLLFFYFGIWNSYRGLFQRMIVLLVFTWLFLLIRKLYQLRSAKSES